MVTELGIGIQEQKVLSIAPQSDLIASTRETLIYAIALQAQRNGGVGARRSCGAPLLWIGAWSVKICEVALELAHKGSR